MKTHILSLILCFYATLSVASTQTAHVRVVFPFTPTNVTLYIYEQSTRSLAMTKTGTNEFSVTVTGIFVSMLFNISFNFAPNNITKHYIASGEIYLTDKVPTRFDAHGLKYGKIYINNQLINSTYTVENVFGTGLNIAVKVNTNNTIEPFLTNGYKHLFIDDRIPAEVHHRNTYLNTQLPKANHTKIVAWMQAITDNNIMGDSKVEMDYIRLFGRRGNDSVLLASHEYNTYSPTNDGGLYLRYPFFPKGFDQHDPMPGTVKDGILTFYPSNVRDRVWHWWSNWYHSPTVFNFDSYKMVGRIRITGHVVVQGGIDFRDAAAETYELGASDWYFEKGGVWQEVVFDTRHFKRTSVNSSVKGQKGVEHQLSLHIEGFQLWYTNLIPGDYYFKIFDVNGKLLENRRVSIENYAGSLLIKSHYVNQQKLFLYELSNSEGLSLKGKLTL